MVDGAAQKLEPQQIMQRCLEISKQGIPEAFPNPLVGAALVAHGEILASSYHKKFGGPHAEVNLLAAFEAADIPGGSSLYVTLEPCSHFGKTPPCADLVIARGIRHVVVATEDVFPAVAGQGIARLRAAGVAVDVGLCRREARELNARFFIYHRLRRPYIILKWAQSTDGFMAPLPARRLQISNDQAQVINHQWRAACDAILVGTDTALIDDPALTVRRVAGKNPLRVVLDRQQRLPERLKIFADAEAATLVVGYTEVKRGPGVATYVLKSRGVEELPELIAALYERNVQSLIVEGGPTLLASFVALGLWDEARIVKAPVALKSGIAAPQLSGTLKAEEQVGNNTIVTITHPDLPIRLGLIETTP